MFLKGALWPGFCRRRYQSAHYAADYPRAWDIDTAFDPQKANKSESDEEDDGSSAEEEANVQAVPTHVGKDGRSPGFADFLQFLELGCGGSPLQGYPAVIVILSSIPPSVGIHPPPSYYHSINPGVDLQQILLHSDSGVPASPFFSSFWAAVDGRALSALDRNAASAAFLSSLLECTAFVVRRVRNAREKVGNSGYGENAEKELVCAQYSRVWEECTSRRLRVEKVAGELVAKSLVRLNEINAGIRVPLTSCEMLKQILSGVGLFDAAWGAFMPGMTVPFDSADAPNRQFLFSLLKAFRTVFVGGSHPHSVADELFQRIVGGVLEQSRAALLSQMHDEDNHRILDVLLDLISTFGDDLFTGVDQAEVGMLISDNPSLYLYLLFVKALDGIILEHSSKILSVSSRLLTTYLSCRSNPTVTLELWRSLLESLPSQLIYTVLPYLLDAAERHALPHHLKPAQNEFDKSISVIFSDAIGSANPDALPLLLRVIRYSGAPE
jgi:E3 ubiquitin-protein ligase listerin